MFSGIFFSTQSVSAQDPQLSQFYSSPLYLNPAFAGANIKTRVVLNYRNQWPTLPGAFVTYGLSVDQNFEEFNSGAGIIVMHDQAGTGDLSSTKIGGLYSYKIRLPRDWVVRAGLHYAWVRQSVHFNQLTFGDQLNKDGSVDNSSSESFQGNRLSYGDLSSGLLAYNNNIWIGLAADHLNMPNNSLLQDNHTLPVKYSLHGGVKIPLEQRYRGRGEAPEINLSPTFQYKSQGINDQLDLGVYFQYKQLVTGLWYRSLPIKQEDPNIWNHDALVFLAGFKKDRLRIGYSYDLTVSKLTPGTGGAHELSIAYEFDYGYNARDKKKQREEFIPAPKY